MKLFINIARVIVGILFIFSGLVKAIDPLGLAYKMQEFFEVWGSAGYLSFAMNWLHNYAILFSIIMISLEVALGVALLIGWQKKMVTWLLLLLMLFFTFLTSYVLFSGKITACGCFGDCIPLTPAQTFTKDIILLILVILLLFGRKYIQPLFNDMLLIGIMLVTTMGVILLQDNVMKHLPIVDCLPYKKGNDLLRLRQMPADAIPDKYDYLFVYEKNGEKKEFTTDKLPDSSWKFVERKQVLIQKGKNNVPAINDFALKVNSEVFVYEKDSTTEEFTTNNLPDSTWNLVEKKNVTADSTETILGQNGTYYLFFIKELGGGTGNWSTQFADLLQKAKQQRRKIYIITSDKENVEEFFNKLNKYNVPVYFSDATAIKTAARANPTLFLMKGPVVQGKWSWVDMGKAD